MKRTIHVTPMDNLTTEEKLCNYETIKHIQYVSKLLNGFATELILRGQVHDQSKLASPEVELFAIVTPKLANCKYGSEEYQKYLEEIRPALEHHYNNNSHHPQFYKNGIDDMSLLDIIEMFCDWYAAGKRHNNGNIRHSLDINKKRFNMSDQLVNIMENTIDFVEEIK